MVHATQTKNDGERRRTTESDADDNTTDVSTTNQAGYEHIINSDNHNVDVEVVDT